MPDFDYRGYQVSLRSYQVAGGQWIAEAHLRRTTGDVPMTPIRAESGMVFSAQQAANDAVGRLAIKWIDYQEKVLTHA